MDILFLRDSFSHAIILFYCPFDSTFHKIVIFHCETIKNPWERDRNYSCHSALFIAHKTSDFVSFFFFPFLFPFFLFSHFYCTSRYKCVKGKLQLSIVRIDWFSGFSPIYGKNDRSHVSLTSEYAARFLFFCTICSGITKNIW